MSDYTDLSCKKFVDELSAKAATPGGGGASALVGAIGMALGNMTAALTIGKDKYKDVESEVKAIMSKADDIQGDLLELVDEDARAFKPLAEAYKLPASTDKDKERKAFVMEQCLRDACDVPLEIMRACCDAIELHAMLSKIGSKMAISDVGCGVICCKAALRAASLNVFINTKSMKDREYADKCDTEAEDMLDKGSALAEEVFAFVEQRIGESS